MTTWPYGYVQCSVHRESGSGEPKAYQYLTLSSSRNQTMRGVAVRARPLRVVRGGIAVKGVVEYALELEWRQAEDQLSHLVAGHEIR